MKKALFLLLIFLTACTVKDDYYALNIDDYSITVGYDDSKYMKIAFEYELPETMQANETIKDVDIYLFGSLLGVGEFANYKNKEISSDKAKLSKLVVYVNDLPGRSFKINGEELDSSIKNNCDKYNGTYIEKNGYACVIENKVGEDLDVIELHGDYLDINQDKLDRIEIYVK